MLDGGARSNRIWKLTAVCSRDDVNSVAKINDAVHVRQNVLEDDACNGTCCPRFLGRSVLSSGRFDSAKRNALKTNQIQIPLCLFLPRRAI